MNYNIDQNFYNFFNKRLKQVFLYLTDECNLRCKQCLYKPNILFQIGNKEINVKDAVALLSDFQELGAVKLSILGGEPSLYDAINNNKSFCEILESAKKLGYSYIRLVTNGDFPISFLNLPALKNLNEISFSLDGYTESTHDMLRGKGQFNKSINSIKKAVELGYNVAVTTCVHRGLIEKEDGIYLLEKMINYIEEIGVNEINFHILFKHGFPMDSWTGETDITWKDWLDVRDYLNHKIEKKHWKIKIRVPQHFVSKEEFSNKPNYYGYCPVKLGERVMVHPDGIIRICSGLISTKYGVARYYDRKIAWDNSPTNEILDHKFDTSTPCTNQSKSMDSGNLIPLCFSFKPHQNEYVWSKSIDWDSECNH